MSRIAKMQQLLSRAQRFHQDTLGPLMEYDQLQRKGHLTAEEMADLVFLMKQAEPLLADLKSTINTVMELMQNLAAAKFLKSPEVMANPGRVHIEGQLTKAEINVRVHASIPSPKKEPVEYRKMMMALGVSEQCIENDHVRPHFPKICDLITELAAQGKPPPPGLGATYPRYWLTCRKKNRG